MHILIFLSAFYFLACGKSEEPNQNGNSNGNQVGLNLVIEDEINGLPLVLVGNEKTKFIAGFEKPNFGSALEFSADNTSYGVLMTDNLGNSYDLSGRIVGGPNEGSKLTLVEGMTAYWFAIAAFYPDVDVYGIANAGTGTVPEPTNSDWSVSSEFIFSGAGLDAIPSVDEPVFTDIQASVHNVDASLEIEDEDLCILVNVGDEYRAYPHYILDWHEIVNDEIAGEPLSIVYCPLTGSASVWSRMIDGQVTTFGVSGLLYNNNIIPYDRSSNSRWSQVYNQSIAGDLQSQDAFSYAYIQAPWSELKKLNVPLKILSTETGFFRNYDEYPYGDYRTNNEFLLFPSSHIEERVANKELTYLIGVNGEFKAYPLSVFAE